MLVVQLYDQSRAVAMEALSVLSEACEEEANLVTLSSMRPAVLHLGNKVGVVHMWQTNHTHVCSCGW